MLAQVGPTERAAAFFEALATQRWREAAAMVHPERRAAIHEHEMAVVVGYAVHRDKIKKMLREQTSSGGISLGSEDGRWRDELPKVGHLALPGFGDATTIRAVAELDPSSLLPAFWPRPRSVATQRGPAPSDCNAALLAR